MERNRDVITEIDDFKNALEISRDLHTEGQTVADAVEIMAQWCATLREHYCEIGKQTANLSGA